MNFDEYYRCYEENPESARAFIEAEKQKNAKDPMLIYAIVLFDLDYDHRRSTEENYKDLKSILSKVPQDKQPPVFYTYFLLSCDLQNWKEAIKIGELFLQNQIFEPHLIAVLAQVYYQSDNYEKAKESALKVLELENVSLEDKTDAYRIRVLCMIHEKKYEEARQFVRELHFVLEDTYFISRSMLQIELNAQEDFVQIDQLLKTLVDSHPEEEWGLYQLTCDFLLNSPHIEQANRYVERLLQVAKEEEQILSAKVTAIYHAFYNENKITKAIEIADTISEKDFEKNHDLLHHCAILYSCAHEKRYTEKAITLYKKNHQDSLFSAYRLALIAKERNEWEEVLRYATFLKSKKEMMGFELLGDYYLTMRKYWKAQMYYQKTNRISDVLKAVRFPYFIKKQLFSLYKKKRDYFDYRQLANCYLNGYLNVKPSLELALEYATTAYEMAPNNPCTLSMLGNVYLHQNRENEAFVLFEKGYDAYVNGESCTCAYAFYCYALYYGYGVKKDEDKAFALLEKLVTFSFQSCSENALNFYAYLCLQKNIHLKEAYHYLSKSCDSRYEVGREYYRLALAKRLNYPTKKIQQAFRASLKRATVFEKNHYRAENQRPYFNNY